MPRAAAVSIRGGLVLSLSVSVLLLSACDSVAGPDVHDEAVFPIETDRAQYTLHGDAVGLRAEIAVVYTNRTGRTVFLSNCRGSTHIGMDKRIDGEWTRVWGNVVSSCLSPPIEILPGRTLEDTVSLFAGYPGNRAHPKLHVDEVDGTYRLVWTGLHHRGDEAEQLPTERRISNPFRLETPD